MYYTFYCAGTPCNTFKHMLTMQLDSTTGSIQSVELKPQDIDMQGIAQAAIAADRQPSFVV